MLPWRAHGRRVRDWPRQQRDTGQDIGSDARHRALSPCFCAMWASRCSMAMHSHRRCRPFRVWVNRRKNCCWISSCGSCRAHPRWGSSIGVMQRTWPTCGFIELENNAWLKRSCLACRARGGSVFELNLRSVALGETAIVRQYLPRLWNDFVVVAICSLVNAGITSPRSACISEIHSKYRASSLPKAGGTKELRIGSNAKSLRNLLISNAIPRASVGGFGLGGGSKVWVGIKGLAGSNDRCDVSTFYRGSRWTTRAFER